MIRCRKRFFRWDLSGRKLISEELDMTRVIQMKCFKVKRCSQEIYMELIKVLIWMMYTDEAMCSTNIQRVRLSLEQFGVFLKRHLYGDLLFEIEVASLFIARLGV